MMTLIERGDQRRFVDQRTARGVDQHAAATHPREARAFNSCRVSSDNGTCRLTTSARSSNSSSRDERIR